MSEATMEADIPPLEMEEAEPKTKRRGRAKLTNGVDDSQLPVACVGLPVQFYFSEKETLPGFLQRQSIVEDSLWDVKISLAGAGTMVTRAAVRYSSERKVGCWGFLPGWRYDG